MQALRRNIAGSGFPGWEILFAITVLPGLMCLYYYSHRKFIDKNELTQISGTLKGWHIASAGRSGTKSLIIQLCEYPYFFSVSPSCYRKAFNRDFFVNESANRLITLSVHQKDLNKPANPPLSEKHYVSVYGVFSRRRTYLNVDDALTAYHRDIKYALYIGWILILAFPLCMAGIYYEEKKKKFKD